MKKKVLIADCSSGFGRALCYEYHIQGYYVIATARNEKSLDETEADLKVSMDVSDRDSIERAVKFILTKVERIDVLVNNAGYSVRSAVEEIDLDKLKQMYEVNVFGMLNSMQAILPIMRSQVPWIQTFLRHFQRIRMKE